MKENICNYISDKEMISKVYKELHSITTTKTTQFKNGQRLEQIFLKKRYQMDNKHKNDEHH